MKINNEHYQWRESSPKAIIPFIVFILFYFGFSLWTRDFSKVPMTVAFLISSVAALTLNHKEKLGKKIEKAVCAGILLHFDGRKFTYFKVYTLLYI